MERHRRVRGRSQGYRGNDYVVVVPCRASLCPAYVLQVASIHRLDQYANETLYRLGLASATVFATLAGLNYVVQLSVVRAGMLAGRTEELAGLVFQNPDSLMLTVDFVGWFFLGLAFLTVVPSFKTGMLSSAIRYLLISSAFAGGILLLGLATSNPAIGQIFLVVMSALLTCADILLMIFFKRLL